MTVGVVVVDELEPVEVEPVEVEPVEVEPVEVEFEPVEVELDVEDACGRVEVALRTLVMQNPS